MIFFFLIYAKTLRFSLLIEFYDHVNGVLLPPHLDHIRTEACINRFKKRWRHQTVDSEWTSDMT